MLRTLYTTAVRSGAVQHAAVADVRLVEDGHRVLRFHGKGDGRETTERLKPLVPYAAAAVDFYLALVADRLGVPVGQLDGHAFRTTPYQGRRRGRELRSDALIDMMRTIAITADIAPDKIVKLSPHSLRHTAATLLGKTKTLAEVQDFLDHADPRTTRTYLHTDQSLNSSLAYSTMAFIQVPARSAPSSSRSSPVRAV
ncbi:tyrosine-type recombinase/integrase [Amycolatopsis sp. NPDC001319]|uniref:tyrosine-type recombinase/integrase n=1 Tax=unclassified Amycolatopsis TaxID=2618356 RepID=UPI0036B22CF9